MYPVNVEMLSPSIDTFLPSSTDFFATTGFPAATAVVDAAALPGAATTFRLPALAQLFCGIRSVSTLPQPDDISTAQHKIPTIKP